MNRMGSDVFPEIAPSPHTNSTDFINIALPRDEDDHRQATVTDVDVL